MTKTILTKVERSQFFLSQDLKETLVGLLLGDLCSQKQRETFNPIFRFEQGKNISIIYMSCLNPIVHQNQK